MRKATSMVRSSILLAAVIAGAPAQAAVVLSTATYSQDFNSLANSGTSSVLPDGWSLAETGANANNSYAAGTGSSNIGNTYSFGILNSTERALGGVASISLIPSYGVSFVNNLAGPITSLQLSYSGELWRVGSSGVTNTLRFSYSLDATSLTSGTYTNFTDLDYVVAPVGAAGFRDGNANSTAISGTIVGLNIERGATFFLRWAGANEPNDDHGLAIDDFRLNAAFRDPDIVPEPASWVLLIAGFGLVGAAMRHRRVVAAA